jgi:hypothetical protein
MSENNLDIENTVSRIVSTVPKKGDIIINPNTQRPIRVGSKTWLGLVKKGIFEGHYTDPKQLAVIEDPNTVEVLIEEANKTLPKGKQAVRGRGKYKGKIVSRDKHPTTEDVSKYTATIASKVVSENIEELAECDDLEAELERLILQEMAGTNKPKKTKRIRDKGEEYYELEESAIFDSEESEESE